MMFSDERSNGQMQPLNAILTSECPEWLRLWKSYTQATEALRGSDDPQVKLNYVNAQAAFESHFE